MTRGRLSLVAVIVVALAAAVVIRIARSEEPPAADGAERPSQLALLVMNTDAGPFVAVVGANGSLAPAGLVLPGKIDITIPGQGDGTIDDATQLPGSTAATAIANLLGVPIAHHVSFGQGRIAAVVDRAGGLEVGGTQMPGAEVVDSLLASEGAADAVWETTLEAVLDTVTWEAADLPQADRPADVAALLNAARGASVEVLPAEEVTGGILRTDPEAIRLIVTSAWGAPDREVLPIVVLNGSGAPGIGEEVAERVIPGGFRVVVSENASDFDHETTMIVVATEEHRALGERVRDLLGVGEVQVAGPASGLADVTVVVGKDLGA
jgi:hypothetical protein